MTVPPSPRAGGGGGGTVTTLVVGGGISRAGQGSTEGGGVSRSVNVVWETLHLKLAAQFPTCNPGASAKFHAHERRFTVDSGVPLSKFKHMSGPQTTLTLITGGVWQMGLPCIVRGTCG